MSLSLAVPIATLYMATKRSFMLNFLSLKLGSYTDRVYTLH